MSSITDRVCAVVEQLGKRNLSVGPADLLSAHLELEQLVALAEELEDEFRIKLDSDDVVEAETVLDVANVVTRAIGLITAH